jgi:hypothetical protein
MPFLSVNLFCQMFAAAVMVDNLEPGDFNATLIQPSGLI